MADTKISDLPAAGALAGTEPVPIVQGAATVRTTVQHIANLATAGTPAASAVTYDNTASGLTATDVQDAIDELAAAPGGADTWMTISKALAFGSTFAGFRSVTGRRDSGIEESGATGTFQNTGSLADDAIRAIFPQSVPTSGTLNSQVGYHTIRAIGSLRDSAFPALRGFRFRFAWGISGNQAASAGAPALKSDARLTFGLVSSGGAPSTTARIDSYTNAFLIGKDDDDTNLQLYHCDGNTANATKVDLGLSMAAIDRVPLLLEITAPSNPASGMAYALTNAATGASLASGTVTTNLPAADQYLFPLLIANNGSLSTTTVRLWLGGWIFESANGGF